MIELEQAVADGLERETELRIQLRTAEEAPERAEENLRRAFGPAAGGDRAKAPVQDDDARAVLNILRSGS